MSVDEASSIVEASRPEDDAQFVVNILSSIANVEARCYSRMRELGGVTRARERCTPREVGRKRRLERYAFEGDG